MSESTEVGKVGFGFKPRDDQLVGHYLKKKLKGESKTDCPIPELNIYNWEPPDLFTLYDVFSSELSDGQECFFFCPRSCKRKTKRGFWKETSSERVVLAPQTREPLGTKRYFVYHEGRQPKARRTDVSMHEYHLNADVSDSEISDRTALVLYRIINRKSKKAKSATASASTNISGLSNLIRAQATPEVTIESDHPTKMFNSALPDRNVPIPDQQSQICNEQLSSDDNNGHVDGPSDGCCYMPNSLSDDIDLTEFLSSGESKGLAQTWKEQHLAYDNRHVDGPSDRRCYMPYSPGNGISLEDLPKSD